jgi:hypothetical protein
MVFSSFLGSQAIAIAYLWSAFSFALLFITSLWYKSVKGTKPSTEPTHGFKGIYSKIIRFLHYCAVLYPLFYVIVNVALCIFVFMFVQAVNDVKRKLQTVAGLLNISGFDQIEAISQAVHHGVASLVVVLCLNILILFILGLSSLITEGGAFKHGWTIQRRATMYRILASGLLFTCIVNFEAALMAWLVKSLNVSKGHNDDYSIEGIRASAIREVIQSCQSGNDLGTALFSVIPPGQYGQGISVIQGGNAIIRTKIGQQLHYNPEKASFIDTLAFGLQSSLPGNPREIQSLIGKLRSELGCEKLAEKIQVGITSLGNIKDMLTRIALLGPLMFGPLLQGWLYLPSE